LDLAPAALLHPIAIMLAMKISLTSMLAAMLPAGLHASSATGQPSCKCLGSKEKFHCGKASAPCITVVDCKAAWSTGKCVNVTSDSVVFREYQSDYGDSCKVHEEPGSADCYNLTAGKPVKKKKENQKGWCNDAWCYVDCCACDAGDTAYSHWFKPVKIPYSYQTCGASDKFTTAQADNTGKCETKGCPAAPDQDASGAQMVATTLAMPVVLFSVWSMQ